MSGGSYNYLCYKEINDLIYDKSDLRNMVDRLIELGYKDVAKETESLILTIDSFEVRASARIDRLKDVWHSVEWYDSGDSGKESIEKSVNEYREK